MLKKSSNGNFKNLEDLLPHEILEKIYPQKKFPASSSEMGRDFALRGALDQITQYIQDIKPFGNIECKVTTTNNKVYTSCPGPSGEIVREWGAIELDNISSSILSVMSALRGYMGANGRKP